MRYRLRYQHHDLELIEGRFLIGRSATCQLSLDDPLVSRNHAVLTVGTDSVVLEDLGSRNGVRVNGARIEGERPLVHGDRITIGSQELLMLKKRDVPTDTQIQPATQRGPAFGLLGALADKAIALGHGDDAERILNTHMLQVLEDARRGHDPGADVCEKAARYAVKLAGVTAKGRWVDYVFELYAAVRRPCATEIVDELYEVLRRVKQVSLGSLRTYVGVLKEGASSLGPSERFLLSRLEGLERLAALR
jgi:hypothetical protein